jgi:hypothetical protein
MCRAAANIVQAHTSTAATASATSRLFKRHVVARCCHHSRRLLLTRMTNEV